MFPFDHSRYPTIEEALSRMRSAWKPEPGREIVKIGESLGRVCAEDIRARFDMPVHRSAQCDALALKSDFFQGGPPDTSTWREDHEYTQVDMGDDFNDRFDSLIPVEYAQRRENSLSLPVDLQVKPGQLINQKGSSFEKGDLIIAARQRINGLLMAGLAMSGWDELEVLKKPKVVFIPTGNELVTAPGPPGRGQIVDSNSFMARGFLEQWGAKVINYPVIRDIKADLRRALGQAEQEADLVLINGGSAKGRDDLCAGLLQDGADVFIHHVKAAPGRPVVLSMKDNRPRINIPGPSMATFCILNWAVKPLIEHFNGLDSLNKSRIVVEVAESFDHGSELAFTVWFEVTRETGRLRAYPLNLWGKNSELMRRANAYRIFPVGQTGANQGDILEVDWIYPQD